MHIANNCHSIACLNCVYKLYTDSITQVLYDHIHTNNIMTKAQISAKPRFCNTTEKFLSNKKIYEAKKLCRDLFMNFLDYQKGFYLVFQKWLMWPLHLVKVIDTLASRPAVLEFQGQKGTTITIPIIFLVGKFHGNIFRVILLTLLVNILSLPFN